MFHSDKPIKNSQFDRLNRKSFAQELANAILSYTEKDNFTMSICGKWGSGKTSIINMIVEEIEKKTESDKERPIIVCFNPWNYSECSQLISQFFESISHELKIKNQGDAMEQIGNAIDNYSDMLSYLTYVPITGKFLKPLPGITKGIGSSLSHKGKQKKSLIYQKKNITKKLAEQNRKIIVIIDDIDRLNNEQIRLIFQLVNSVAGFPNVIYILSFDKEIVARALEAEQECNGEEYLEKIIQVPFDIPEANKKDITDIFIELLDQTIIETDKNNIDSDYWSAIFTHSISPFINTLRDVYRVINTFKFKYGYLHSEINFNDLLAITTFQVCASPIYSWVQDNIKNLTGSSYGQGISGVEQKSNKATILEELKKVYCKPELMLSALQPLFPRLSWNTGGFYTSTSVTSKELKRTKRIADPDRCALYFQLSIDKIMVTSQLLKESIVNYTSEQLDDLFIELFKTDNIKRYLSELDSNIHSLPSERYPLFISKLLELTTHEYQQKNMLDFSPDYYCYQCCWSIFISLGEEESYKIICNLLSTLNIEAFNALVYMIIQVEKAYGRIGNSSDYNSRIVSEDQLSSLEEVAIKRVVSEANKTFIFRFKNFWGLYHLWKYKNSETLEKHIKESIQNINNIPYFLPFVCETWIGEKDRGWSFREDLITKYLSTDALYNMVLLVKDSNEFKNLENEQKELMAAFCLWYESPKKDHHEITKENVSSLLLKWNNNP